MVLFRARDPLGNEMRLYSDTWYDHVVNGGHPEVEPYLTLVHTAVVSPEQIWTSKHSERRIIYFTGVPQRPQLELAVVGDVSRGVILTAYLYRPRGSRGGKTLWPN